MVDYIYQFLLKLQSSFAAYMEEQPVTHFFCYKLSLEVLEGVVADSTSVANGGQPLQILEFGFGVRSTITEFALNVIISAFCSTHLDSRHRKKNVFIKTTGVPNCSY